MRFIPYKYRPSLGFMLLVTSWILVAAFLVWGSRTPDLDVAWKVRHQIRVEGSVALTDDEAAALRRVLNAHPEIRLEIRPGNMAVVRVEETGE